VVGGALLVLLAEVVLRAFVVISKKGHEVPRGQFFLGDNGERVGFFLESCSGQEAVSPPFPSGVVRSSSNLGSAVNLVEIERLSRRIIPTSFYGIIDEVRRSKKTSVVFKVDLTDAEPVGQDHELVVGDPLGDPQAADDDFHPPAFTGVGDAENIAVLPVIAAVPILLDEPAHGLDRLSGTARALQRERHEFFEVDSPSVLKKLLSAGPCIIDDGDLAFVDPVTFGGGPDEREGLLDLRDCLAVFKPKELAGFVAFSRIPAKGLEVIPPVFIVPEED
jgi:hypothetical protein